jgi:leader peptidase (prepilin peptidase) / N-methyltransferase
VTPPALDAFVTIGALIVGASVGSFLNVVVARVPAGLSIVRPGSRCPRCLAPIAWHDNLPVVSWLLLRARCRACGAPISARYPLLELAGAAAALLALRRHGLSSAAAAEMAFASLLLALGLIDLDTWLLPHALTWPLLGAGLALSALGLTPAGSLAPALYGAGIGFAAFAALAVAGRKVLGREALGFGDVWLLAGLGAWLGVGALLPVVLLASLQGTAVGLVLAGLGRLPKGEAAPSPSPPPGEREKTIPGREPPLPLRRVSGGEGRGEGAEANWVPPRNAVPFGPFLVAGALEWLYLGDRLASAIPGLQPFR